MPCVSVAASNEPTRGEAAPRSYRFPQSHRLKQQRLIRPLFDRQRSDVRTAAAGCVRLLARVAPRTETGADVPVLVGFAPGRMRTAVQRNRVKRIMREVYRVHQHLLIDLFSLRADCLTLMVLYRGRPDQAATCLPGDLPEAMRRIARALEGAE